jgi:hypothetical protein
MGTKHHIINKSLTDSFITELAKVDGAFSNMYEHFHRKSRSLQCLIFSDSYILYWNDIREGLRFILPVTEFIKNSIARINISYRIFAHIGDEYEITNDRVILFSKHERRFLKYCPISMASWGTFIGEGSHFSKGIYFSNQLVSNLEIEGNQFSYCSCICENFEFKKYFG